MILYIRYLYTPRNHVSVCFCVIFRVNFIGFSSRPIPCGTPVLPIHLEHRPNSPTFPSLPTPQSSINGMCTDPSQIAAFNANGPSGLGLTSLFTQNPTGASATNGNLACAVAAR